MYIYFLLCNLPRPSLSAPPVSRGQGVGEGAQPIVLIFPSYDEMHFCSFSQIIIWFFFAELFVLVLQILEKP